MGTQRHCLMVFVWGTGVAWDLPSLPCPDGDIPAGPLKLTGLWWGKQSCSRPSLSQHHCEMSGQLLEDDSRVYGEGMVLHRHLGCSGDLLPAHHGSKQKCHGVHGLAVLERKAAWVLRQMFQWFICTSFFYVQTLHRAGPESWGR